jgi:tetratricopeptide (TPR) repeat protein
VSYHTVTLWATIALLLFSGTAPAQSSLEKAVQLVKHRNYAEAEKLLVGMPEPAENVQRIAFHRLKAAIASGLGKPALAVAEMQSALALAPQDSSLLLATAIAEMQAQLLDDALHHAEAAEKTPQAWAVIGDVKEKRGDYEAAVTAYQSAISLAPDQEAYRVAMGLALIQHQSLPASVELLKRSVAAFPQSAKLRTLLGIAHYASGFSDEAIAAFEGAINIDPHFAPAYNCLEQVLLESSAAPKPEAVTILCQWNTVACSAVRLRVAREAGDAATIRQAIIALEKAPAQNVTARCELARAYEWSHELNDARRAMEVCVSRDPTPQNYYRLGMLYQKLGLSDLAHRQMELRSQMLAKTSQETAAGMNVLGNFKLALK